MFSNPPFPLSDAYIFFYHYQSLQLSTVVGDLSVSQTLMPLSVFPWCQCQKSSECQVKCAFPFSCSSEREQLLLDCAVFVNGTGKAGIQRKVFKRASCFWVKESTQEEWQESEVHFQPIVFPPTSWTRSLSASVMMDDDNSREIHLEI